MSIPVRVSRTDDTYAVPAGQIAPFTAQPDRFWGSLPYNFPGIILSSRDGQGGSQTHTGSTGYQGGALLGKWLPGRLRSNLDLTLEEHREALEEEFGVRVCAATVSRRISCLPGGWPVKKSRP